MLKFLRSLFARPNPQSSTGNSSPPSAQTAYGPNPTPEQMQRNYEAAVKSNKKYSTSEILGDDFIELVGDACSTSYDKILFEPAGMRYTNPGGTPRRENYSYLQHGTRLRVFWDKQNEHDESALALFPPGIISDMDEMLGYIPRTISKGLLKLHNKGFVVTVHVDYIKEWYRNSDEFGEDPHYDCRLRANVYVSNTADFKDRLLFRAGVSQPVAEEMISSGLDSPEKIVNSDDATLLSFKGIGPKKLAAIRAEFSC